MGMFLRGGTAGFPCAVPHAEFSLRCWSVTVRVPVGPSVSGRALGALGLNALDQPPVVPPGLIPTPNVTKR
jgi:hypothetical protein